jgi:four helix bundle protein
MAGRPIQTFRDLIAWQRGMSLAEHVYVFVRLLPREEEFGLKSQIRRAATSVPLNVAEGYGLGSRDQFLKHLRHARGSCMEVDTGVELACRIYALDVPNELHDIIAETDRVLQGLIRSVASTDHQSPNDTR